MSKTTKLLLLDSLLQEVCIESGLDASLTLSVCLVSHNLLYSGLKIALLTMRLIKTIEAFHIGSPMCRSQLNQGPLGH